MGGADMLWCCVVLCVLCSVRGAGIKLFGPDRVHAFCRANNIDVIIR